MDLFIPATTVAKIIGWTSADFRALRRTLKPPLPIQRGNRTGSGRTPDLLELTATIRWLDSIISGGLRSDIAERFADHASPIY